MIRRSCLEDFLEKHAEGTNPSSTDDARSFSASIAAFALIFVHRLRLHLTRLRSMRPEMAQVGLGCSYAKVRKRVDKCPEYDSDDYAYEGGVNEQNQRASVRG